MNPTIIVVSPNEQPSTIPTISPAFRPVSPELVVSWLEPDDPDPDDPAHDPELVDDALSHVGGELLHVWSA